MTTPDKYNFKAPQFLESFSNVEDADNGADKFFDADDVISKPGNSVADVVEDGAEKHVDNEEVNPGASHDGEIELNNENLPPGSLKKIGRESKLNRLSIKPQNLPLRRSARFTSLAEQIHKFHHATPPRFKRKSGIHNSRNNKFLPTIAHSPRLQTKNRARPSTAPSLLTEERPALKSIKKPQVQAKPPPKPAPKPTTVPQPFKLTDPSKLKNLRKPENEKPDSIAKKNTNPVNPVKKTPQKPVNVKRKHLALVGGKVVMQENWAISGLKTIDRPNRRTKVVPFSFEQRDQERLKAKQTKLEEIKESKVVDFKAPAARPAPKFRASLAAPKTDVNKKSIGRSSLANKEK